MKRILALTAIFSTISIVGYAGYTTYSYETDSTFENQSSLIKDIEKDLKNKEYSTADKKIKKLSKSLDNNKYEGFENKLLGLSYYQQGNYEKALEHTYKYYTFLDKSNFYENYGKDMLEAQYYLANIYHNLSDYEEGYKYAEFVLNNNDNKYKDKDLVTLKYVYANGLFLKESHYEAQKLLLEILPSVKNKGMKENSYLILGQIYHNKIVDLNKAVEYYLLAYNVNKNLDYGLLLLDLYANNGDTESVELISEELLLKENITNYQKAKIHSYKGIAYYRAGNLANALKSFVKSNNLLKQEEAEVDFKDANNIYSIYIYYELEEFEMVKTIIKNTENEIVSDELGSVIKEYKKKLKELEDAQSEEAEETEETDNSEE